LKNIDQDKAKPSLVFKKKRISDFAQRHENDSSSGGIGSIIPSLIGVLVLGGILLARSGFRGRATVAGIDLGTTNSVVCVQEQAAKEGGKLLFYIISYRFYTLFVAHTAAMFTYSWKDKLYTRSKQLIAHHSICGIISRPSSRQFIVCT
jgi:hypothetical protein